MTNINLNAAVRRLAADHRFLERFRRDPEAALEGFDLPADDVEALERGDPGELLALGLDPTLVHPVALRRAPTQSWADRGPRHRYRGAVLRCARSGP